MLRVLWVIKEKLDCKGNIYAMTRIESINIGQQFHLSNSRIGLRGLRGPDGPQGYIGMKGQKGEPGLDGYDGVPGAIGLKGLL